MTVLIEVLLLPTSSSALSRLLPDTASERAEAHRQYWNSSPGMILSCPRGTGVGVGGNTSSSGRCGTVRYRRMNHLYSGMSDSLVDMYKV